MAETLTRKPRTPRDHAVDPRAFGTTDVIRWSYVQSGKTEDFTRLVAAQTQHHYAVAINRRLIATERDVKKYAAECSLGYDRTRKVMRGAVAMSLNDIACAELVLHEIITPDVFKAIRATIRETRERLAEIISPHG